MRHLLKAVFVYGALEVPYARTRTPSVSGQAIADGDVALEAQIEDWRSRWQRQAIADGDVALEAQIEDWRSRWHPIP